MHTLTWITMYLRSHSFLCLNLVQFNKHIVYLLCERNMLNSGDQKMKKMLSLPSGLVLLRFIVLENNNCYNKSWSNNNLYFKMPLNFFSWNLEWPRIWRTLLLNQGGGNSHKSTYLKSVSLVFTAQRYQTLFPY